MQGEERDSSDEEWETAYAEMDPASQLGWRNRRGPVEGPGERLMRDIFEAADAVHSAAMSHMDGRRSDDNDESHVGVDATPLGSVLRTGDGCGSPTTSVEVEQEGDHVFHFTKTSYFPFCMYVGVHAYANSHLSSSVYCICTPAHKQGRRGAIDPVALARTKKSPVRSPSAMTAAIHVAGL